MKCLLDIFIHPDAPTNPFTLTYKYAQVTHTKKKIMKLSLGLASPSYSSFLPIHCSYPSFGYHFCYKSNSFPLIIFSLLNSVGILSLVLLDSCYNCRTPIPLKILCLGCLLQHTSNSYNLSFFILVSSFCPRVFIASVVQGPLLTLMTSDQLCPMQRPLATCYN